MASSNRQYKDSASFISFSIMGILILLLVMLLTSCMGTYYLTDAEYSDAREENASITYYNNQIYWGWNSGYYYYYGKPHSYPWYYYYNICPPSHYHTTTHIIINKPIIKDSRIEDLNMEDSPIHKSNNKVIIKSNNGSKRTNKTTIRRKPKK